MRYVRFWDGFYWRVEFKAEDSNRQTKFFLKDIEWISVVAHQERKELLLMKILNWFLLLEVRIMEYSLTSKCFVFRCRAGLFYLENQDANAWLLRKLRRELFVRRHLITWNDTYSRNPSFTPVGPKRTVHLKWRVYGPRLGKVCLPTLVASALLRRKTVGSPTLVASGCFFFFFRFSVILYRNCKKNSYWKNIYGKKNILSIEAFISVICNSIWVD